MPTVFFGTQVVVDVLLDGMLSPSANFLCGIDTNRVLFENQSLRVVFLTPLCKSNLFISLLPLCIHVALLAFRFKSN